MIEEPENQMLDPELSSRGITTEHLADPLPQLLLLLFIPVIAIL